MYLLGAHLPDHKLVRIALTNFYGISYDTARRLCARLQLHESATVSSLSDSQITQLSAFLSSPGSIPAKSPSPTSPDLAPSPSQNQSQQKQCEEEIPEASLPASQRSDVKSDPLRSLVLESDLRRSVIANISHHRTVGSYTGRRHLQGLPVRGQRTRTNANSAKKLNRIERRAFSSTGTGSWTERALKLAAEGL